MQLTKHSSESTVFDMDFSQMEEILGGQTIASVTAVTAELLRGSGGIAIGPLGFSSSMAQARLSGGTAGDLYNIEFTVLTNENNVLTLCGQLLIEACPTGMPLSQFFDAVRCWAGDVADTAAQQIYKDGAIERGLRTIVRCGLVKGYTMSNDNNSVTPPPDANGYFLISAKTAQAFISARPDSYSYATRGFRESVSGANREISLNLAQLVYRAEHGLGFTGWSDFASFLEGLSGVRNSWLHFVRLKVSGMPFQEATISNAGVALG